MSKPVRLLLPAGQEMFDAACYYEKQVDIRRFPYRLFYRVDSDEIVVLAVMHQKRHPAYWLPRKELQ